MKKAKRKKKMSEKTMVSEEGEKVSIEEVVAAQSIMIKDLLEAYHLAGKAINRLESYTFSLVKIALDNELVPYNQLIDHCSDLMNSETLEEFWGIEEEEKEEKEEKEDCAQQSLPLELKED